ncbi:MAG: hypothetical protein ACYCXG_07100 [Acidiferrobacter sp.]
MSHAQDSADGGERPVAAHRADFDASWAWRIRRYFADRDLAMVQADVAACLRAHPAATVLAGLGAGFLLGKTVRR